MCVYTHIPRNIEMPIAQKKEKIWTAVNAVFQGKLSAWARVPYIRQPCLRRCDGLSCCSPSSYCGGPASIVGQSIWIFFRESDSKTRFSPTTAVSPFNIIPQILPTHTFIFDATRSRSTNGEAFGPSSRSAALLELGDLRESRKLLLFSFTKSLHLVYTCYCKQHFICLVLSQRTNVNTRTHGHYVTNIKILGTGQTHPSWGQYTSKTITTTVVELTTLRHAPRAGGRVSTPSQTVAEWDGPGL